MYAIAPRRFSRKPPSFAVAAGADSGCMERPQPGQKAAEPGICAAQCGHDFTGGSVSTIAATIANSSIRSKGRGNQSSALTQAIAKSMFRENFVRRRHGAARKE